MSGILVFSVGRWLAAGVMTLALVAVPAAARADSTYGPKYFDRQSPSFSASDSNGTFNGQMTFVVGGRPFVNNPMAWSFSLNPNLQAIATSNMDCNAYQNENGQLTAYHDHHNIPTSALWHSTVPSNSLGYDELLTGSCSFRVNVAGRSGTAVVTFRFHYSNANGEAPLRRMMSFHDSPAYGAVTRIAYYS